MVVGYVLAAGVVWPRWLSVVSGMFAGCDRCAAAEPPADPRDALIREQAERIAALEALVTDLRERLEAAERAGVVEQRALVDAAVVG